jgi:predicted methyltransferase/DNA-directed RNA polymerase subunit RPC12/RpoP
VGNDQDIQNGIVAEVAAAVRLDEGPVGVRDVIRAIARHEPIAVKEISRHAELPVPLVTAVCNELRARGVVSRERPVQLTEYGRQAFARPWLPTVCSACSGRRLVLPAELSPLVEELTVLSAEEPAAKVEIDQTHCTVDSKVHRVLLMADFGVLDRDVIFLGDDDLTSLALARFGALTGSGTGRISVVDVDADLLAFIGRQAQRLGVDVEVIEHDLTKPLPSSLRGVYHVAFTDPPYTVPGAELFLSRAVSALMPAAGQQIFFAFGGRRPDETVLVQSMMTEMGLAIRSLQPNFSTYEGAGILAGTSHLYHLRTTEGTAPATEGVHTGVLYTADTRSVRARPYRCVNCKNVLMVGPDQLWPQIARLKESGCPHCGAGTFRPMALIPR